MISILEIYIFVFYSFLVVSLSAGNSLVRDGAEAFEGRIGGGSDLGADCHFEPFVETIRGIGKACSSLGRSGGYCARMDGVPSPN